MNFINKSIKNYVLSHSTQNSRQRTFDSQILNLIKKNNIIEAKVKGTLIYSVKINFEKCKIDSTSCTCPYDQGGICKHRILVLFEADKMNDYDEIIANENTEFEGLETFPVIKGNSVYQTYSDNFLNPQKNTFTFKNIHFYEIDDDFISFFSNVQKNQMKINYDCTIHKLNINSGSFAGLISYWDNSYLEVVYHPENKELVLECKCKQIKQKMCEHQSAWLKIFMINPDIRLYFDAEFRNEKLKQIAKDYGLENEENLDDFFTINRSFNSNDVSLVRKDILPLNELHANKLMRDFLPEKIKLQENKSVSFELKKGIVFSQSRYTTNFFIHYFEAKTTKEGNIKNPLKEINPIHDIDAYDDVDSIKFLTAISLFKDRYENSNTLKDKIKALKTIAKNPLKLPIYYHDTKISDNITVNSVKEIKIVSSPHTHMSFQVKENGNFYEILAYIHLNGKKIHLRTVKLKYEVIFLHDQLFYIIENTYFLKLYKFFKDKSFKISIHKSKFEQFKSDFLHTIEDKIELNYTFIKPASKKQIEEQGFNNELKKTIYLEESESYILITPSVKYGNLEIPILSQKQINAIDEQGDWFSVERDRYLEDNFAGLCLRLHPNFEEQLGEFEYFYLHKHEFLDSGWFIDAFEEWKNNDVEVLGFNTLKNNNLTINKMKVNVQVSSGLDWFDTSVKIKFGNEEVSLKQVQKALKNSSRFVALDDGTKGMMPEEWIQKFSKYFRSGELVDGKIRTSKINFSVIDELYEKEVLAEDVVNELTHLNQKITSFKSIENVKVPKNLKATLRDYQKQGLNWLNFLDEFNFGGCLADDMGLGKTVQVLAFILAQKEKLKKASHLIVVPTSLLFNWQREMDKFAPSLKYYCIYGARRIKGVHEFDLYDVILTTYGTLLSDIKYLKEFRFQSIFLDESQAIKNPDSQRYKAVRLLQAKNRVVLTGTPIENNTFDLYAQMSFANPGLFVNQTRFKDEFSTPIDKFKDIARAKELQQKINPFILRRTKKQVAKELPDKTEMVLFCEMDQEQKKVYDTYKNQIRDMLTNPKSEETPENKSMLVLKGLTKLRQICDSPKLLSDDADYGESSAKMRVLMDEIETKSLNHKILVFSQFVDMLDLIRTELDKLQISHEYLTGQTKDREERVHNFQNDTEIRVFLISLKAGGTGLNLTEADYVYLVDPWWNPAVENQAIDRCYRIGQKKNVVAVRLICPDTIEEKIMLLQENKRELADDIIKTDLNIMKSLSEKDLIGLFS